ncbi:MAG: deoxyribose-phosphate aldolase [Nitrospirae bacterium]|nr:deoxyribose-phosphate aldolase [Nitrospirota bacterium]
MKSTIKTNIAKLIDHTLLRPDATERDIVRLCDEAKRHGFFSVCVHPAFIKTAKDQLAGTKIKLSSVIGFPLGMTLTKVKIYEAMEAVFQGADELDAVMNPGFAKSGRWEGVESEIEDLITATPDSVHKIIIETCYLNEDEKKRAALIVMNAGAGFVKTSTGFGTSGAAIKDVELIKAVTKGKVGIKAAGGIKTLKDVIAFVKAGATRIGTSSGVSIMKELEKDRNLLP